MRLITPTTPSLNVKESRGGKMSKLVSLSIQAQYIGKDEPMGAAGAVPTKTLC